MNLVTLSEFPEDTDVRSLVHELILPTVPSTDKIVKDQILAGAAENPVNLYSSDREQRHSNLGSCLKHSVLPRNFANRRAIQRRSAGDSANGSMEAATLKFI